MKKSKPAPIRGGKRFVRTGIAKREMRVVHNPRMTRGRAGSELDKTEGECADKRRRTKKVNVIRERERSEGEKGGCVQNSGKWPMGTP